MRKPIPGADNAVVDIRLNPRHIRVRVLFRLRMADCEILEDAREERRLVVMAPDWTAFEAAFYGSHDLTYTRRPPHA